MFNSLQYPGLNSKRFAIMAIDHGNVNRIPLFYWLLNGKLGENLQITPSYREQVSTPSAKNRYFSSVNTSAIPASDTTVTLAANAVLTTKEPGISTAVSSDPAVATATAANDTATVTGVAAGTSTITVKDQNGDVMETIVVTVA